MSPYKFQKKLEHFLKSETRFKEDGNVLNIAAQVLERTAVAEVQHQLIFWTLHPDSKGESLFQQ